MAARGVCLTEKARARRGQEQTRCTRTDASVAEILLCQRFEHLALRLNHCSPFDRHHHDMGNALPFLSRQLHCYIIKVYFERRAYLSINAMISHEQQLPVAATPNPCPCTALVSPRFCPYK